MTKQISPKILSERIAEAKALSVRLPARYRARQVSLCITRHGKGWQIGAMDDVKNRYPVMIGGKEHKTVYLSRRQAFEAMEALGHHINAKYIATPAKEKAECLPC